MPNTIDILHPTHNNWQHMRHTTCSGMIYKSFIVSRILFLALFIYETFWCKIGKEISKTK